MSPKADKSMKALLKAIEAFKDLHERPHLTEMEDAALRFDFIRGMNLK